MKKLFLLLLLSLGLFAQPGYEGKSGYSQNILWRDMHPSTQDSLKAIIGDSANANISDSVSVARVNQRRLGRSVAEFNSGSADSTALAAADAWAAANNGKVIIDTTVTLTNGYTAPGDVFWEGRPGGQINAGTGLSFANSVSIEGVGRERLLIHGGSVSAGTGLINLAPSSTATTTLADTLFPNNDNEGRIVVADGTNFTTGMLIKIESSTAWPMGNGNKGEFHRLRAVSNDTLWTYDRIADSYDPSAETVTITEYPATEMSLKNVHVRFDALENSVGIYARYTTGSKIENVQVDSAQYGSFLLFYHHNLAVENSHAYWSNTTNLGYGVWLGNVNGATVTNSFVSNSSRGIDISGGPVSRNVRILGNKLDGSGYASDGTLHYDNGGAGVNSHQVSEQVYIADNTITNFRTGVAIQGNNYTISNNTFGGKMLTPVTVNRGQNHTISGNIYDPVLNSKDSLGTAGKFYSNVPASFIKIESSASQWTQRGYLRIWGNSGFWTTSFLASSLANTDTLYNLSLMHNHGFDTDGGNVQLISGNTTMLKHPTIEYNDVRPLLGAASVAMASVFENETNFFGDARVAFWSGSNYVVKDTVDVKSIKLGSNAKMVFGDSLYFVVGSDTFVVRTKK